MVDKKVNIRVKTTGADKAERSFKGIGKSLAGMAAASISIGLVAKNLGEMVNRAGQIQGVEKAFSRLNVSLSELRDATKGTVSDFDLMQQTIKAANLNVPVKNFADMLKFAKIRAQETGESIDYLVESIVLGLGRESPKILDNLGISTLELAKRKKELGSVAAAAMSIINEDLAEMDENLSPLADDVGRIGGAFSNLYDEVAKVIGTGAEEGGIITFFADALEGMVKYVSFWYGDGSKVWEAQKKEIDDTGDEIKVTKTEYQEWVETLEEARDTEERELGFWRQYAAEMGLVAQEYIPTVVDGIEKLTLKLREQEKPIKKLSQEYEDIPIKIKSNFEEIKPVADQLISTFDYVFTETLINNQNFADAMVAGFRSMLERMVAEIAARAAVFGIFSMFGGGGLLGGLANFVLSPLGITGVSPGIHDSGSTVNINMPNVTMINSRSIGQMKQAFRLHDRRH